MATRDQAPASQRSPEGEPPIHVSAGLSRLLRAFGVDTQHIYSGFELMHHLAVIAGVLVGPLVTATLVFVAMPRLFEVSQTAAAVAAAVAWFMYTVIEYSVAVTPTPRRKRDRLKLGGFRLLLVFSLSFLAGEFGTEEYFATEVRAEVVHLRQAGLHEVAEKVRATADERVQTDDLRADRQTKLAERDALDSELAAANAAVQEKQRLVDDERDGKLGGRPEGRGPEFRRKIMELDAATKARDEVAGRVKHEKSALTAEVKRIDAEIERLENAVDDRVNAAIASLSKDPASPAERFHALNNITLGAGDYHRLPMRGVITLLLILLESSGIVLKLSRQPRHDREVIEKSELGEATVVESLQRAKHGIDRARQERQIQGEVDRQAWQNVMSDLVDLRTKELLHNAQLDHVTRLAALADEIRARIEEADADDVGTELTPRISPTI